MNDLHDLLHDAVDDIEPADRLAELRARTASPAHAARPWFYAAGATVLATAAAVAVVAVMDGGPAPVGPSHEGMHHSDGPSTTPGPPLVPVYYLGDGDLLRPGGDCGGECEQREQREKAAHGLFIGANARGATRRW